MISLFEVFNAAGVFGINQAGMLEKFSELTNIPASDAKDDKLIALFRESPDKSLKLLSQAARSLGYKTVSYKVFPQQLEPSSMQALLSDPNRTFVLIGRRRLDTYISYVKAQRAKAWTQTNTTDVKVRVNVDDFLAWSKTCDDWFAMCQAGLDQNKQRYVIFNYESDICHPKPIVVENIRSRLAGVNKRLRRRLFKSETKFQKQDHNADVFSKISNSDQVRQTLMDLGQLDYAMDRPV